MAKSIVENKVNMIVTLLKWTYGLYFIAAGADKLLKLIFNRYFIVDWAKYVSPIISQNIPMDITTFLYLIGAIEVAVGLLIIFRPKIGSYIGFALLSLIALNVLSLGAYFDIVVRDAVINIGFIALAQLTDVDRRINNNSN